MAVLDLERCPVCQARDSLARQTTQLESRIHVTYECLICGTVLTWLGDEMWLEADRWSFQKVGRPERTDLLYRSMTVAELRKLAGEKPPAPPALPEKKPPRPKPPFWVDIAPAEEATPRAEAQPERVPEEVPAEPEPVSARAAPAAEVPVEEVEPEPEPVSARAAPVTEAPAEAEAPVAEEVPPEAVASVAVEPEPEPVSARAAPVTEAPAEAEAPVVEEPEPEPVSARAAPAAVAWAEVAASVESQPVEPFPRAEPERRPGRSQPSPPQISTARRRSRGSPFLVISVALVLLCLICSAAGMIIYSLVGDWPPGAAVSTEPPTVEAMPTETPVPTATPIPTETPAPTEVVDDVAFQGVTSYLSDTGSYYLVGEVFNGTADTLRFVEVLATFYDGNGQVVGTSSSFTELSFVGPGGTAPFKLTALDFSQAGRYELQVDYETTSQPPIQLEIVSHGGTLDGGGWYRIMGEVRNPHGFTVKFPEIVATFYNGAHEVVRVEVAFGQVDPLEPGQTSPFEVVLTEPPADMRHYDLNTEAAQQ